MPRNHCYCRAQIALNEETKFRAAPEQITTAEIIQWGTKRGSWLQGPRNIIGVKLDPIHKLGHQEGQHCVPVAILRSR